MLPASELNCTDFFYYSNITGTCLPTCGWILTGRDVSFIIGVIFGVFSIVFPLIYFVLALTVQRKWLVAV